MYSPNSNDNQAAKGAMACSEELSALHDRTKDDDPNALCFWHFDQDPNQLHQDDRCIHEVDPLLKEDEVVDVCFVGIGTALQEEVNLDGDVCSQSEG